MREAAAVFARRYFSCACIFAALLAVCPPAHSQSAARIWGGAYYQAVGDDAAASDPTLWGIAQETGLSLNVQGAGGLELLADFTLPFAPDRILRRKQSSPSFSCASLRSTARRSPPEGSA